MKVKVEMKRHGKIQSEMEVARLHKLLTLLTHDIWVRFCRAGKMAV